MLSTIEIKNFQSLSDIKLELKPFTVIEGRSSSGKSAFVRAMHTLTANRRGDAFISHGERTCSIKAQSDHGTVMLKRSKGTGDNEYVLIPNDPTIEQRTYTKLGGTVPPEVSDFLGIAPKDPINFAGQWDGPYLLEESSGEVARVLGALTNVNTIFDGARESNRRKLASASTLKTRTADYDAIVEKAKSYGPLKEQMAALAKAEASLTTATAAQARLDAFENARATAETATRARARLDALADISIPDASQAVEALERLRTFQRAVASLKAESQEIRQATAQTEAAATEIETAQAEYIDMLIKAGTCPTCKQSTSELEHTHV